MSCATTLDTVLCHAGEAALNRLAVPFGGWLRHNRQSLRIVDFLEHPYVDCRSLNPDVMRRGGLAKHKSPFDKPAQQEFSESAARWKGQVRRGPTHRV